MFRGDYEVVRKVVEEKVTCDVKVERMPLRVEGLNGRV